MKLLKLILLFLPVFIFLYLALPKTVFACTWVWDDAVGATVCLDACDIYFGNCGSSGGNPGTCAKSDTSSCPSCSSPSNGCCSFAPAWSKWDAQCVKTDTFTGECQWRWEYNTQVCSTADTCISGQTGLVPGFCDCTSGSSIYKACCNGSTANYCSGGDHTGTCPNQTITGTSCPAASPTPTPTPTCPTKTCDYNQIDDRTTGKCTSGLLNCNGVTNATGGCDYQSCLNTGAETGGCTCVAPKYGCNTSQNCVLDMTSGSYATSACGTGCATSTCDGCTYPQTCDPGTGAGKGIQVCKGKNNSSSPPVCLYDSGCSPGCTTCTAKFKCSVTSSCVADGAGSYNAADCGGSCTPSCNDSLCGIWTNGSCGAGGCSANQRQQTRTCPAGSTCSTSQCATDSSCSSSNPTYDTNIYVDPSTVTQGNTAIVTVTATSGCETYITFDTGTGFSGCTETRALGSGGTNPKDSNIFWGTWRCTAGNSLGTYTATFTAGGTGWGANNNPSCASSASYTITSTPPAPNKTLPTCIANGDNGAGLIFLWTDNSISATYMDISTDNFTTFYHKAVSSGGTNGKDFNGFGFSGTLTYSPNTTYYARLYNGYVNGPILTFTTPSLCVCPGQWGNCDTNPPGLSWTCNGIWTINPGPNLGYNNWCSTNTARSLCYTCAPTAGDWIQTTGDVHSNTRINAPGGPSN